MTDTTQTTKFMPLEYLQEASDKCAETGVEVRLTTVGFQVRFMKKHKGKWLTSERYATYRECATANIDILPRLIDEVIEHVDFEIKRRKSND